MAGMFGHTWISQYGPKPDGLGGDTWAAALSGISGAQLAQGLRETLLLASDFPPSAPRFRALCLGIPTIGAVRREIASRDAERSPFARLVWSFLDSYRMRHVDADKADRMVGDAYEMAREHVMRGGELPRESPAIERSAPEPIKPASPEAVAAALKSVETLFGSSHDQG